MKLKIVKNKIFTPFKEAAVNLIYGHGIDRVDEVFQVALKAGLIQQSGAWFTYIDQETGEIKQINGEEVRTQGRAKMLDMIHENPELYHELENLIRGVEVEADEMTEEEKKQAKDEEKE